MPDISLKKDPKKFNALGIKLAKQDKVPVFPVAVKTDFWGMGRWFKDSGRIDPSKPVRVSFGEPVHVGGNGKPEHRPTVVFIGSKQVRVLILIFLCGLRAFVVCRPSVTCTHQRFKQIF